MGNFLSHNELEAHAAQQPKRYVTSRSAGTPDHQPDDPTGAHNASGHRSRTT